MTAHHSPKLKLGENESEPAPPILIWWPTLQCLSSLSPIIIKSLLSS